MWRAGAVDNSPLLNFMIEAVALLPSKSYQRRFICAAADANTGGYYIFNNDNTEFGPELARATVSSASMPFAFPPQKWRGTVFMDGGSMWNMNFIKAVHEC